MHRTDLLQSIEISMLLYASFLITVPVALAQKVAVVVEQLAVAMHHAVEEVTLVDEFFCYEASPAVRQSIDTLAFVQLCSFVAYSKSPYEASE